MYADDLRRDFVTYPKSVISYVNSILSAQFSVTLCERKCFNFHWNSTQQ